MDELPPSHFVSTYLKLHRFTNVNAPKQGHLFLLIGFL